jgi:hypothetical protein
VIKYFVLEVWIMAWKEDRVERFEDFSDHVRDMMPSLTSGSHFYWFRGQSSTGWALRPSLGRRLLPLNVGSPQITEIEDCARSAFQGQAHFFVNPALLAQVRTIPCWWALMQHHGAPTRLLDWTESPYVAAYFAVQPDESRDDGAIWCFCGNNLRRNIEQEVGGRPPGFHEPSADAWYADRLRELNGREIVMPLEFSFPSSERMVAQQGRFTMCFAALAGHDCLIRNVEPEHVRKLVIPNERKVEFLLRLREMNITGSSLFPGVDGLGRSVAELIAVRAKFPGSPMIADPATDAQRARA